MLLCKIEVNKVSGLNTTALVKVSQDMERKPFFVPAVKLAVFIKILPKTMPECQYNWHLIDKRECLYTCIQHFWILTVPQNMGLQEKKPKSFAAYAYGAYANKHFRSPLPRTWYRVIQKKLKSGNVTFSKVLQLELGEQFLLKAPLGAVCLCSSWVFLTYLSPLRTWPN